MVENKKSVYDSENPPLVEAIPTTGEVQEEDPLQLNTDTAVEESTSSSTQSNASSIETSQHCSRRKKNCLEIAQLELACFQVS